VPMVKPPALSQGRHGPAKTPPKETKKKNPVARFLGPRGSHAHQIWTAGSCMCRGGMAKISAGYDLGRPQNRPRPDPTRKRRTPASLPACPALIGQPPGTLSQSEAFLRHRRDRDEHCWWTPPTIETQAKPGTKRERSQEQNTKQAPLRSPPQTPNSGQGNVATRLRRLCVVTVPVFCDFFSTPRIFLKFFWPRAHKPLVPSLATLWSNSEILPVAEI